MRSPCLAFWVVRCGLTPFPRSSPNRRPPSLTVTVAQIGRHPSERPHPIPNPGRPDRRPAAPLHRPDPLVLRAGLGRCGPRGSRSAYADPLRHASLQVCREQRSGEGQTYSWSSPKAGIHVVARCTVTAGCRGCGGRERPGATEWPGGHLAVASEIGDARAVEKRYGLRGRYPPALVVI
jgi:hypothetical protein